MKKLLLTSATVFGIAAFCSAANANITANAESASCDNSTIGATSGTTTLEAQWQANTIDISWYDGDTEITPINESAGECTYDGALTVPSNTMSRNGYTFDGWKVKPVSASCGINNWDYGEYQSRGHKDGGGPNNAENKKDGDNSSLNVGEWYVTTSNGTVKGTSDCNSYSGTSTLASGPTYIYNNDAVPEKDFNTNNNGGYCWCKITELNGTACLNAPWMSLASNVNLETSGCPWVCASYCSQWIYQLPVFREVIFGLTQ